LIERDLAEEEGVTRDKNNFLNTTQRAHTSTRSITYLVLHLCMSLFCLLLVLLFLLWGEY
jgi:hypothetical protein